MARRGLLHFALGKVGSAALGASFLLLTVRLLDPVAYGRYITVMAMAEMFYLVTGLGLSTVAQRYVAEYRLRAPASEFAALLRSQFRRRLVYSACGTGLLLLTWPQAMAWSGLALDKSWMGPLALLLAASAGVSFLEEVLGACLLQGYAQGLAVMRNLLRVAVVVLAARLGDGLQLRTLLWAEALVALGSWLAAEALVRRWARQTPSAADVAPGYQAAAMAAVSRRFYAVQLVGQAYGVNIGKLLVMRFLGAGQAAVFGVAQSIADMVRNYLPAQLLAGWVRPLMVARYLQRQDMDEVCMIANLVFKLNLLGLLPLLALFATVGDTVLAGLSAGRYPEAAGVLTILMLALVLQTAHLLLSMITLTLEAPAANLRATGLAACTLPLVVWLVAAMGVQGAAWAMVLTEGVWIASAFVMLRRHGHRIAVEMGGIAKLSFEAALAAGAATGLVHFGLSALGAAAALVVVFVLSCLVLRPATSREIDQISRLLRQRGAVA